MSVRTQFLSTEHGEDLLSGAEGTLKTGVGSSILRTVFPESQLAPSGSPSPPLYGRAQGCRGGYWLQLDLRFSIQEETRTG